MRVALGSDHAGYELKETIREHLKGVKIEVVDLGTSSMESVDYPDIALKVALAIKEGEANLGILVCGTGVGMCIVANKVKGIRAALCHDVFSAKATREHNDANVLCLGSRVIGQGLALEIVDAWLKGSFQGGRHERRVKKILEIEKRLGQGGEGLEGIRATISKVTEELIEVAGLRKGQILVVGCSTSEILGNRIGTTGDPHLAREVMEGLREVLEPRGLNLAAQGCEHINRALVVERRVMEAYGLTEVWVHPVPHAGGAFASEALKVMEDPVVVESVQAHAGMDIGNTLIGMHLRPVAVPVRVSEDRIGRAALVLARTRPRLVGGARARYKGDKEERFKKGSE